ncbi:MAG TPA: ATP-binding protein [Pirellulales bacterium]
MHPIRMAENDTATATDERWSWHVEECIPSETGAGSRILQQVLNQLELHDYTQRDIFDVHMALEEALVNAIKHGNKLDAAKKVHVVCKMSRNRLRLEVEDEGPGFKPEDVPDPTLPENLELPNGRGIMLMKSFMSKVEYNDRGNSVVMEKIRSA